MANHAGKKSESLSHEFVQHLPGPSSLGAKWLRCLRTKKLATRLEGAGGQIFKQLPLRSVVR